MKHTTTFQPYIHSIYRKNRGNFTAALIFTMLGTLFSLFFSWVMGELLNIITSGDMGRLWHMLGIAAAAAVVMTCSDIALYRFKSRFIHKGLKQYKNFVFEKLAKKDISAFLRENTGKYISALTNDTNSIEEKYLNGTLLLVYQSVLLAGSLLMMLGLSWKLGLITLILSVLPMALAYSMEGELTIREQKVSGQNEGFVSTVKDLLNGFSVIKSYKAEDAAIEALERSNSEMEHQKERRRWWDGLLAAVTNASGTVVQFGIFFAGAWMAINGEIQIGTILTIFNLCNFILQPIQTIPQFRAERKAAVSLIEKMDQWMEENPSRQGQPIEARLQHSIDLKEVSVEYEPGKTVLNQVNLEFHQGRKYAIVGMSGAGKSTILKLLTGGISQYQGEVFIDGHELKEISTDSLYDMITLLSQEVFVFDTTIQNNITMFQEFPQEQIEGALGMSGLKNLLKERGASYVCGENGCHLSGGERQRMAIARSILKGTSVMLMDEAVAALDNQVAVEIEEALLNLKDVTQIVVTHRLSERILQKYDEIIVMKEGAVWEKGSFEELMKEKGYFYSLYMVTGR